MQLQGGVPLTEPSVPLQALGSPSRALFDSPLVGHSPCFNCMGPRDASKQKRSWPDLTYL